MIMRGRGFSRSFRRGGAGFEGNIGFDVVACCRTDAGDGVEVLDLAKGDGSVGGGLAFAEGDDVFGAGFPDSGQSDERRPRIGIDPDEVGEPFVGGFGRFAGFRRRCRSGAEQEATGEQRRQQPESAEPGEAWIVCVHIVSLFNEDIPQPVEVIEAEVFEDDFSAVSPFSGGPDLDADAEAAGEFRFEFAEMSLPSGVEGGGGQFGLVFPEGLDVFFELPDGEVFFQNVLGKPFSHCIIGDTQKRAGVAHGEFSLPHHLLDVFGQFQESHVIGEGGAVFPDAFGGLLLGELEACGVASVGFGAFDGVQIAAVDIFDECPLEHVLFFGAADDGGDGFESGELGGFAAAFAGDDLIPFSGGADEDRLDQAIGPDGVGEFLEFLGIPVDAGLMGVFCNGSERDFLKGVTGGRGRGRLVGVMDHFILNGKSGGGADGFGFQLGQSGGGDEGIEASAQAFFYFRHNNSIY